MNLIQPHGVLLVLNNQHQIIQASENTTEVLGQSPKDLLNRPLADYIGEAPLQEMLEKLDRWQVSNHFPYQLEWQPAEAKSFSALLHKRPNYLILELEPAAPPAAPDFGQFYKEISYVIAAAKEAVSIRDLSQVAVHELKRLSEFDRVMVYQFDEDWNGTVIAEAREEEMESYLELRFPASDIPPQARELYHRTPYRLIPNAQAQPTKLFPVVNGVTNSLTDISQCILRGVPLVHTEYLKNMEVQASMSTPIIIDNRLWGLISCHNRQPKHPLPQVRSTFEVVSGIIAAQLSSRVREENYQRHLALHSLKLQMIEQIFSADTLKHSLIAKPQILMELLQVKGLALLENNEWHTNGEVPPQPELAAIQRWLVRFNRDKIFTTNSLVHHIPNAENYRDAGSGLIALQLGPNRYLLGFRPEVLQEVSWGGNPNERINFADDGKNYHPRNSFKQWREQVEYTSQPWSDATLEAAQDIRTALLERIVQLEEI